MSYVTVAPTCKRRSSLAAQAERLMLAALLVVLGWTSWGCKREAADRPGAVLSSTPSAFEGIELFDQDGRRLFMADYEDKVLVLSFMFTSCPTVCPRQTRELSAVQRAIPEAVRARVRFLSVSVDPANDTPQALKEFARAHAVEWSGWSFASSSDADTRQLTARLAAFNPGLAKEPAPGDHSTALFLFDTRGRLLQRYAGAPLDVPRLAREIQQLAAASGSERLGAMSL